MGLPTNPIERKEATHRYYLNEKNSGTRKKRYEKHYREKRALVEALKEDVGCVQCGPEVSWPGYCLDWHHLDPNEKGKEISRMFCGHSIQAIQAEIDKCVCLCSNHHRMVTHGD